MSLGLCTKVWPKKPTTGVCRLCLTFLSRGSLVEKSARNAEDAILGVTVF